MFNRADASDHLADTARRQHQRIAAGQDYFPDFRMRLDVSKRVLELLPRQHLLARSDHLAPEAEAAIDRADTDDLEQHTIRITMHDSFDRRMSVVADRIGALVRCR